MPTIGRKTSIRAARAEEVRKYFEDAARRKVQRRRAESEFIRQLQHNSKLSHMDEIEQRLIERSKEKPPPEEKPKSQPEPPATTVTCVGTFDAPIRCLEISQGGTTLWSGEADGSIGVRNGVSGKLSYVIEKSEDCCVDCLHGTESQMWVGLSDGKIRIYDLLVYVLAFECQGHNKSVTSFASTFDGKMFSASLDSSLVKWDNEANEFEVLARITDNMQPIRVLACYGYNLFVGGDGGVIQCLDTESGAQVQLFEGHTAKVNTLLVSEGFLFSGSDDKTMVVWRIDIAQPVKVWEIHTAAVTALHIDVVAHQVWSSDAAGTIHIFDSTPRSSHDANNFGLVQTFTCDDGAGVINLKGIVAMDAVKIWSIGSNGSNKVWHSAKNKLELAVSAAVDAMNSIIEEDAVELAKWADLIRTLELVADRLIKSMTTTMTVSTTRAVQRLCFLRWLMWIHRHYHKKQLKFIVKRLEERAKTMLRRRYFQTFDKFMHNAQRRRRNEAIAVALSNDSKRSLLQLYFAKLKMSRAMILIQKRKLACVEALSRINERRLATRYFGSWMQFHDAQSRKKRRQRMAVALLHVTLSSLRRSAYIRWKIHSQRRINRVRNAYAAGLYLEKIMNASRAVAWHEWQRFVAARTAEKQRLTASRWLLQSSSSLVMRSYYCKWHRFTTAQCTAKLNAELESKKPVVADLQAQIKGIEHLVRRRKLVEAAQGAIDSAIAERIKKQMRIAEIEQELKSLQTSIDEKRSGDATKKRQQTIAQQLDDILSQLKCKVLNLHHDFGLIAITQNRSKNVGVVKCFLEAHMAVKRVVVEMTNDPNLPSDKPWPVTSMSALKSHHVNTVLTAIKTMTIAFDIMTPMDRAGITTDQEIVLNGKLLMDLADHCVAARVAKLGGSTAFRVRR